MLECTYCENTQASAGQDKCKLLIAAYVFAGLAMMLNIRLSYSSAPYALIRFKLPENLFSVFVRRMASALELWCLPSMLLGNIMENGLKGYYKSKNYTSGDFSNHSGNLIKPSTIQITENTGGSPGTKTYTITVTNLTHINDTLAARKIKNGVVIVPSIVTQWLNFLTYVILLVVYVIGGDQGHLTTFYFVIAISGVVFGINMVLLYAVDWNYIPVYMVGENSFPIVTSFMHYLTTLMFGNRRKWNSDFLIVMIDIGVAIIISFTAAILWTLAYGIYTDTKKTGVITGYNSRPSITGNIKYGNCPEPDKEATSTQATIANHNDTGATLTINNITDTSGALGPTGGTQCSVNVDPDKNKVTINYTPTGGGTKQCIEITLGAGNITKADTAKTVQYGHIFTEGFDTSPIRWPEIVSPALMVIVGMGLVYAIYPGIAPGMIVPFYLIDKIEMVLLIATFFPPVIVALLNRGVFSGTKAYSPKTCPAKDNTGMGGWRTYTPQYCDTAEEVNNYFWHAFDILIVIKISLAVIFICCLHYRDSALSRSIVNQPKMSTILSIVFYMCHECLLALGFPGIIGNNGATYVMLPAQYIGALFMIFLAFYSEGYIIEYKSHDPQHWPTEGMTKWNAFCYWTKRSTKITNHNMRSLFAIDLKVIF